MAHCFYLLFVLGSALTLVTRMLSRPLEPTRVEIGVEPHALALLDRSSRSAFGGTAYFVDAWAAKGRPVRVIDLAEIRSSVEIKPATPSRNIRPPEKTAAVGKVRRTVKAMLFADVKNYAKLKEEQAPAFFARFLKEVARVIQGLKHEPAFSNTWGTGSTSSSIA